MEEFFAGWLGGCAGLLVGHPLDTVKVRQQTWKHESPANMLNVIQKTYAREGVRGFYKGMAFPILCAGVQNSVVFGVFHNTQKMWGEHRYGSANRVTYGEIFVIGAFAGVVQSFFPTCTMELVKIKLQVKEGEHGSREFRDTLKKIFKQHGARGCFQGMNATIIREIPGLGVYMSSYEFLKDKISGTGKMRGQAVSRTDRWTDAEEQVVEVSDVKDEVVSELLAGGAAGVASWIGNIPMDVMKSRLQADDRSNPQYRNYLDCARKSYRAEGGRIFWRGLPATCIRAFPTNAVTFAVVETTRKVYKLLSQDRVEQSV